MKKCLKALKEQTHHKIVNVVTLVLKKTWIKLIMTFVNNYLTRAVNHPIGSLIFPVSCITNACSVVCHLDISICHQHLHSKQGFLPFREIFAQSSVILYK